MSLPVKLTTPGAGPKCSYQHLAAKVEVLVVSFVCEFFQGGWPLAAKWNPAFICLCQHSDLLLSLLHWVEWKDPQGPWCQPPGGEAGQTYEMIARRGCVEAVFCPPWRLSSRDLSFPERWRWFMQETHTHTCVYSWRKWKRFNLYINFLSFMTSSILLPPQPVSGNVDLRITAPSIGWQLSLESAFNGPLQIINWLLNQLNNQPDRSECGALNSFSEREFLEFVTPKPLPALFNKN